MSGNLSRSEILVAKRQKYAKPKHIVLHIITLHNALIRVKHELFMIKRIKIEIFNFE